MKKISAVPENSQYRVAEILESLQGEGWSTGMPAVFIRLGKCNLARGWCDTDYLRFGMMSLPDILGRLEIYAVRDIIITGGEPTVQLHLDTLLDTPKAEDYFLRTETNGLKPTPSQVDYVVISPKTCYVAKHETNCIVEADEVRIAADGDAVALCESIEYKIRVRHYYLSSCE